MSTVLVTGGTGVLGRRVAGLLGDRDGHDVRILSRRTGPDVVVGDLATGAGIGRAVDGAELVVHAASDTRRFGRADERQTATLLGALATAGTVRHLLYVSIVGVDAVPFGYYRRKLACEAMVHASPTPSTVLRATQFHQLIAELLTRTERLPVAPLPLDLPFQPVGADDVAERTVDLLTAAPVGRALDLGGPEVRTLAELTDVWRSIRGRPRRVLRLPLPGAAARAFREGRHTCPDRADGHETWAEFVRARTGPAS